MAVDTLGHLLAVHVTPASADDRGEVERLARTVQAVTGDTVDIVYVDQGYTGERAATAAAAHGIALGSRQTAGGQARLRPTATLTGCRTIIRLEDPLPTPRRRL